MIVDIPADGVSLEGELLVPEGATGLVLFAHGSGSSRHSRRNNFVADRVRERGVATLLFDSLTEAEDETYETRFDVSLLTDRLLAAREWVRRQEELEGLSIGYFGSSTGSAAALRGATRGSDVGAVVSRGGRVDLASDVLEHVRVPTLFIVGEADRQVLELNREAYERVPGVKRLEVIDRAGHHFEEPGALETVADHAGTWFVDHLG